MQNDSNSQSNCQLFIWTIFYKSITTPTCSRSLSCRSLMISALSPEESKLFEYNFCTASLFFGVSIRSVAKTIRAHCEMQERWISVRKCERSNIKRTTWAKSFLQVLDKKKLFPESDLVLTLASNSHHSLRRRSNTWILIFSVLIT